MWLLQLPVGLPGGRGPLRLIRPAPGGRGGGVVLKDPPLIPPRAKSGNPGNKELQTCCNRRRCKILRDCS